MNLLRKACEEAPFEGTAVCVGTYAEGVEARRQLDALGKFGVDVHIHRRREVPIWAVYSGPRLWRRTSELMPEVPRPTVMPGPVIVNPLPTPQTPPVPQPAPQPAAEAVADQPSAEPPADVPQAETPDAKPAPPAEPAPVETTVEPAAEQPPAPEPPAPETPAVQTPLAPPLSTN